VGIDRALTLGVHWPWNSVNVWSPQPGVDDQSWESSSQNAISSHSILHSSTSRQVTSYVWVRLRWTEKLRFQCVHEFSSQLPLQEVSRLSSGWKLTTTLRSIYTCEVEGFGKSSLPDRTTSRDHGPSRSEASKTPRRIWSWEMEWPVARKFWALKGRAETWRRWFPDLLLASCKLMVSSSIWACREPRQYRGTRQQLSTRYGPIGGKLF